MRLGLATIAHGRPDHLARQAMAVARLADVERYVVVAMGQAPPSSTTGDAEVISIPADPARLPLAAARNRAITALGDVDLAILLDVDCIPSAQLPARYGAAARQLDGAGALLCGPVGYLDPLHEAVPEPEQTRRARERVIREFPVTGIAREPRHELFWSLSFAVAPRVHEALGGFDEAYLGYGAEDTDYGLRAREAGVGLWMVAGAWAYHQHHPSSPPRQLAAVVANARRFHDRWGSWPMGDRLAQFAEQGLIEWAPEVGHCELAPACCGRASCS